LRRWKSVGRNIIWAKIGIVSLLLLSIGLAWTGCSSIEKERRGEPTKGEDVRVGKYYYFDDVLIPKELNYKPDESFVYETLQLKTGSMVFKKWRVDSGSLADFFLYHMEKDNWKLVNSFKGKESILNFSKPDKTCTIKIVDKWYGTTEVEVRIGTVR
jgi:hypothetical protein